MSTILPDDTIEGQIVLSHVNHEDPVIRRAARAKQWLQFTQIEGLKVNVSWCVPVADGSRLVK